MARILLIVVWIALTIYAVADWARTPENEIPGRIPKPMWLAIIIFTAPTFSIGAIVWIVLRIVAAAEGGTSSGPSQPRSGGGVPGPLPSLTDLFSGMPGRKSPQQQSSAPDDDPDFLFQLQREIQRKRTEEAKKAAGTSRTGGQSTSRNSGSSAEASFARNEGEAPEEHTPSGESATDSPRTSTSSPPQAQGADSSQPGSLEEPPSGDSDELPGSEPDK